MKVLVVYTKNTERVRKSLSLLRADVSKETKVPALILEEGDHATVIEMDGTAIYMWGNK